MEWPEAITKLSGIDGWTESQGDQPGPGTYHWYVGGDGRVAYAYEDTDDQCLIVLGGEPGSDAGMMLYNGSKALLAELLADG